MKYVETQVLPFNSKDDYAVLERVAESLRNGEICAFPTETVYGLGVLSGQQEAIESLYALKKRSQQKKLAIYINTLAMLDQYKFMFPSFFDEMVDKFLPGPLTIIAHSASGVHGIRYADNPILNHLIGLLEKPLLGTSANMSDEAPCVTAQEVLAQFQHKIRYILDGGKSAIGEASTVLDLTKEPYVFIREGSLFGDVKRFLDSKGVANMVKKNVLVVCTGNTCRSPMAEGILRHMLKEKGIMRQYNVSSCGVYAPFSLGASKEGVEILANRGIDIADHRSRSMTEKMISDADKIIAMSPEHEFSIVDMMPEAKKKVKVLHVSDPMGRGSTYYQQTYELIHKKLEECFTWIIQ